MIEIDEITDVRNHLEGLSAVVFDLDDTLYPEREYVYSGYKAVAAALPQVEDAEKKLRDAFENGDPAIDAVLKAANIFTDELKEECLAIYRNHKPKITLYPGVAELLRRLHEEGFTLGIITDGRPEGQRAKIDALGLRKMVDAIIVTDELGGVEFRKPCTEAYRLMREKTGVGSYTAMCYVGDNIKKDFIAPQKLGMKCIWFKNKEGLYFPRVRKK